MKFINVYAVSRNYGGPEEGGWWWDSGEPIASVPIDDNTLIDHIAEVKKHLIEKLEPVYKTSSGRIGRYSVAGGADVEAYVEDHPAAAWPEKVPHYE